MRNLKTLIGAYLIMGGFGEFSEAKKYMPKIKATRGKRVEVRTEPKIGRNEPCPCGSGKKYKKCCALANE